ncbi:hypothetical protein FFLO_05212 [Filobasidium floriforme]|uniref:Uncharacterized protein n=1 Tax=Filobasidium floriforme TaxID=5210 RepID=A0A8K0JIX0_9TREE|nr:uncharacterized protein HD553DRAFT_322764 [Filobasidium floriforme]KAG7530164.1 hypothetical protein FFLO_05212 [Filobasidium floriforme]KAH8087255.1 hypothetical protein HD553DRAFT_322764 [Filobasidium floriforme]
MTEQQLGNGDTASVLLCLSRGCTSKGGSSLQWSAENQTEEPSFETVPDGHTQRRSSIELPLTSQNPMQSSAITNWSDEARGLCAGSLDQCLDPEGKGIRMGDKHMLAAQWFYRAATGKELSWEVMNRSATDIFRWHDSFTQVEGLMWENSGPIKRYMIRWASSLYNRIHSRCATAQWAASNRNPQPRNKYGGEDELEAAYEEIKHLEFRFETPIVWLSEYSADSTAESIATKREHTSNLHAISSISNVDSESRNSMPCSAVIGDQAGEGQIDNDPMLQPCGIWSCNLTSASINPRYSLAAEYFCEAARPQKLAEDEWSLLSWDIKEYFTRNRHADFLKKVPVSRRDEVGAFMVEVRYQVKMAHSACAAYRRAQAQTSAKTIQRPRKPDIAKAYSLIHDLLPVQNIPDGNKVSETSSSEY